MTGLGAALYGGFFALAALWLYVTADGPAGEEHQGHDHEHDYEGQRPERSNSASTSADADGSSPWLASHSPSK